MLCRMKHQLYSILIKRDILVSCQIPHNLGVQ